MRKTFKDYLVVLFGTGLGRGLSFLSSVIVARTLGPENFGKFSIFFVVSVLTWLLPQAFDTSYVRFAKTSTLTEEKNEFLRSAVFLKLIYGFIVVVFSYPLSVILARYVFKRPDVQWLLGFALVSGVFQSFLMSVASIFQEKENFGRFAFVYSFYTGLIFILLLFLSISHLVVTLSQVIWVYFVSSVTVGFFSLAAIWLKKLKRQWRLDKESIRKTFHLSKWAFGTGVLASFFPRLDMLFVTRFLEMNMVGIYSAAQQIIMVISVMTGSVASVFLPKACRAVESAKNFAQFSKEGLLLAGLINVAVILLIIFSPLAINLLYGPQYISASPITQILLVGWFVSIFFLPFGGLFYVIDEAATRFFLEVLRWVIAVPLFLIFIPRWGGLGAAFAISITLIIVTLVSFFCLHISLKKKIK
ncbi:MAG: oligosaccharide flippase family protein [Candidatus Omnitrophica bacterium]|nr:oligosaccharide flippase family protein [Candidatus Omnitrophota bacterium]